jgi:tRNA uridine 5-carbamoylmethylation protein Kti12
MPVDIRALTSPDRTAKEDPMYKDEKKTVRLLILQGVPASGKTTAAKQLQAAEPGVWKRVSRDDLRIMLDDYVFSKENEAHVIKIRNLLIVGFLEAGYNVIVDETCAAPGSVEKIKKVVEGAFLDVLVEVRRFDVTLETALARNAARSGHARVPDDVITRMYHQLYTEGHT